MQIDLRKRLARIQSFPQLVAFLCDELHWPIETEDFEELTFEYTPEELGIDEKNAAKIRELRRLRPLALGQPWGIFFIEFEPKRLPVVALRRILGRVVAKKRASANQPDRQAWAMDDLLFVSNYGEGTERRITFAHFSNLNVGHGQPTLNVLGWDNRDTALHLDAVVQELKDNLTWPDDEYDADGWRKKWRAAFSQRHREVITTSRQLSKRLAELARTIRDRIQSALDIETESGPLTKLMNGFRAALVHDLNGAGFADMYAQTIAYGLLSVRITDPDRSTSDDLAVQMRTNPFLKELMDTFLRLGRQDGYKDGPDFDEVGLSEVVELLDDANMEAVVRDFGDRNPQEDPVIHFYEHFLAAYDKRQKVSRGVFYTPLPVVSCIVRSVDEILRSQFGLVDGLADTTTWGEMAKRYKDLEVPQGIPLDQAFVQILDPATGTGTFLVEAIDQIYKTMVAKWRAQGHGDRKIHVLWNEYVPRSLLPRLHGYEIMVAPYVIAHLKIGLKLFETGFRTEIDERIRVYLTNALDPPGGKQLSLGFLPALAHEAEAVNKVKRNRRFTVIIGNPPYLGEAGRGGDWIAALMRGREIQNDRKTLSYFEVDGKPLNERNPKWLNDLYVRFTRFSQWQLERSGLGIHGFITNHGYLENPTFRGMRWALLAMFDRLYVMDLHGNLKKKEKSPDGSKDENVFDIEQGVAIGLFAKTLLQATEFDSTRVSRTDFWGAREAKYDRLIALEMATVEWTDIVPRPNLFVYKQFDAAIADEFAAWTSVSDIFPIKSVGIVTARDALTVRWSEGEIWRVVTEVAQLDSEKVRSKYGLGRDVQDWKIAWAQDDLRRSGPSKSNIAPILYRPFDSRYTYYTGESRGFLCRPRSDVMGHMLAGRNSAMCVGRAGQVIGAADWDVVFACSSPTDFNLFRRGGNCLFPLYLYPGVIKSDGSLFSQWPLDKYGRAPNLNIEFVNQTIAATGLRFKSNSRGDLRNTFGPHDILAWIYAIFHSPSYRNRYAAQLKLEFPRVPLPGNATLFRKLVEVGHRLLALHLLESEKMAKPITVYSGPNGPEVGRIGWSDDTVWLDAAKTNARQGHRAAGTGTIGFIGVTEQVWDFKIGGYQVCHKWLRDRKGRTLSDEDIEFYQRIIVALNETISAMSDIDKIAETHGGWPKAFQGSVAKASES